MTNEQETVTRLLVEIDYEKDQIDNRILKHTGSNSDLLELIIIKGGIIGKLQTLHNLMEKINLK